MTPKEYTVVVKFKNGSSYGQYHYKTDIPGIVEGDTLVVDSPYESLTLVTVTKIIEGVSPTASKYIVDKVDVSRYNATKEKEKKKKELKKKLDTMKKKLDESAVMDFYSQRDPEFAKLYREYRELG